MAKQMVFDDAARQPLAAGVSKLARAVKSTLGPRGRNAVLDKGWGAPKVTKDGVTVAMDISLDDPEENLGAQLVREAASKTNDVAGDGTTTATVLAEAIYTEGLKMIAAGADPMSLSRGIAKAAKAVTDAVAKLSTPVDIKSKKEIAQVATIAGNNDPVMLKDASPQAVFEECGRAVLEGKDIPGGYFLMPGCDVPPKAPPVNVMQMIAAAREYGQY